MDLLLSLNHAPFRVRLCDSKSETSRAIFFSVVLAPCLPLNHSIHPLDLVSGSSLQQPRHLHQHFRRRHLADQSQQHSVLAYNKYLIKYLCHSEN